MTPREREVLVAQTRATIAPALITAVALDDAQMVEHLLTGLSRQRLYALAVVLADQAETPRRRRRTTPFAARLEDYLWCRETGEDVEGAARRVGIKPATAKTDYEPAFQKGRAA